MISDLGKHEETRWLQDPQLSYLGLKEISRGKEAIRHWNRGVQLMRDIRTRIETFEDDRIEGSAAGCVVPRSIRGADEVVRVGRLARDCG